MKVTQAVCLIFTFLITACANQPKVSVQPIPNGLEAPIPYYPEFGPAPELISGEQIFLLSAQQQVQFEQFLKRQASRNTASHDAVARFLKKFIKTFNFRTETQTAFDTWAKNKGNCMSLAILTKSLADYAGVDVTFELMQSLPIYDRKGTTIIRADHVRSVLHPTRSKSTSGVISLFNSAIRIDYFPIAAASDKKHITDEEFIAIYYRNMAAETLMAGDFSLAYWLSMKSLEYDKHHPHALNMLALIYEKIEKYQDAERLYQFALKYTQEPLELLSNYRDLLVYQNRQAEVEAIEQRLIEYDNNNPFKWLDLADKAFADGDLTRAKNYYEKVIHIAPYLHFGYQGRGQVEFKKGNLRNAKKAYSKAQSLAYDDNTIALYQAKLSALSEYGNRR